MRFEASQVVFWSLSCYKELKLTRNRFTGRTLRDPLIQMQNNYQPAKFGHSQKAKFRDSFWVAYSTLRNETKRNEMVLCETVLCEMVLCETVLCEMVLCETVTTQCFITPYLEYLEFH